MNEVRAVIVADASVATALGTDSESNVKVYFDEAPQGVKPPYVILSIDEEDEPNPTMSGPSELDQYRLDVSVYSPYTYEQNGIPGAKDISELIRTAIDNYSGTSGGVQVVDIDFENGSSFTERLENNPMKVIERIYRVAIRR